MVFLVSGFLFSTSTHVHAQGEPVAPLPVDTTQVMEEASGAVPESTSEFETETGKEEWKGESHCTVNGKEVSCEELFDVAKTGIHVIGSVFVFFVLLGITAFVFWIWMFVHALSHPIENKVVWVLCFIIFGIVTAIIYYFVVKRSYDARVKAALASYTPPPTP